MEALKPCERAHRLIHALEPINPTKWATYYTRIKDHPAGRPLHILLTYYTMDGKPLDTLVALFRDFREKVVSGGKIIVDSGIYSFKNRTGLSAGAGTEANLVMVDLQGDDLNTIRKYVTRYSEFLRATEQYWDFAIDFDGDNLVGLEETDRLHRHILDVSGVPKSRIIRVYHSIRPDVTQWWQELCANPEYTYVAIEGGASHSRDPRFYNPLIRLAHQYGKTVHVLAMASKNFAIQVPVDTYDAATYLAGEIYGDVFTPYGKVSFAASAGDPRHYTKLDPSEVSILREFFSSYGLDYDKMPDNRAERCLANIWFMNDYLDVPWVNVEQHGDLFGGLL